MKKNPLGIVDYRELKENSYYVIDKSLIIKDYLDRGTKVTLLTRPRRFGKTLTMSMMSEFLDITKDSSMLFKDTKIIETEYINELNQWPTIFISFAGAKGNKKELIKSIKQLLLDKYTQYDYIFKNMNYGDEAIYEDIKNNLIHFNDENINNVDNSLSFLMKRLEEYYHKKVMVFIDEYDTPFIEAHVNGYYEDIRKGLSALLHNALKNSLSLQYAMLTGIQRVAKENLFSDLNNPVICTMNDERYAEYCGFNEEETRMILNDYGLELTQEVKDMYDGYRIGNVDIYNPWSILNYVDTKKLKPYWVNTSSNTMIKTAMKKMDQSFKDEYESLIKNGFVETNVTMETSFFEISNNANLWGLLVNAGYLTIIKQIKGSRHRIQIPNQEVETEFKNLTASYFKVSDSTIDNMLYELTELNRQGFIENYRTLLKELPSSLDLVSENSYHMMLLGMCAWLRHDYEVTSNKDIGLGRCDIVLKSKKDKTSYVIEFKKTQRKTYSKENLESLACAAIEQIKEREYDYGLTGHIVYIGLAHFGKQVEMKWEEKN